MFYVFSSNCTTKTPLPMATSYLFLFRVLIEKQMINKIKKKTIEYLKKKNITNSIKISRFIQFIIVFPLYNVYICVVIIV